MKYVTKVDGSLQPFERGRVWRTLRNMGVGEEDADMIAAEIEDAVPDGVKTSTVLRMIRTRASVVRPAVAHRLDLRKALSLIRPKPDFEEYIRILLQEHGYEVRTGCVLAGHCGEHEVDAIARKNGITTFVEVKHHRSYHRMTGLDEGRIARAIFEDLQEGFESGRCAVSIDEALIVCNTRFSEHAKRYAACRGIRHIGWDYPGERNLKSIIQQTQSYPVTIVAGVNAAAAAKLATAGYLMAKQVAYGDASTISRATGIPLQKVLLIADRARGILEP